jgi:hypothetical protein
MEAVRDCRAVVPVAVEETTATEVLLAGFRDWLVSERGLAGETVRCYGSQAKKFLAQLPEPAEEWLMRLDATAVIDIRHPTPCSRSSTLFDTHSSHPCYAASTRT